MIELIVMDIDGTLTDGSIYYSEYKNHGIETKKFSVKDAAGILAAQAMGKQCMFLTGRVSYAVKKRAEDLKIKYVFQGIKNTEQFLTEFINEHNIRPENVLFIGDDLNDIKAMRLVGMVCCPADAADEVIQIANYVSKYNGGNGAVRDILFTLLKKEGLYEEAISKAYGGI